MLQITRLIAKMPTLGAFAYRHQQGKPYVYPDNSLSYTANFLAMLFKMSEPTYSKLMSGWCMHSRCCSSCTPTMSKTAPRTPYGRSAHLRSILTRRWPGVSQRCTGRSTVAPTKLFSPC